MKKIALFGGSFDPVHTGHYNLAKIYAEYFNFDKILIIPTKEAPHKHRAYTANHNQRFCMCEIAFSDMNIAEICDIEFRLEGKSYTINTLIEIEKTYPFTEIYLIIGSDMLITFTEWYKWRDILKKVHILSASRNRKEKNILLDSVKFLKDCGGKVTVLDIDEIEISSSEIRKKIENGENASEYLNKNVYEYIKKENIYGYIREFPERENILSIIKEKLSEKRYNHSLAVEKMSIKLAEIYGADVKKAQIAALLHDVMKCESPKNLLQFLEDNGIILSDIEKENSSLWHSIAGGIYLEKFLNISDRDILNAVRYHTTARPGMSILEKIIYTADIVSEDREYPDVDKFRRLVYSNLDLAIYRILCYNIGDLLLKGKNIHLNTAEAYREFYCLLFSPSTSYKK